MRIEPSDKVAAAALTGFTQLFEGAKITLAETARAVTPCGGLGNFIAGSGRSRAARTLT